MTWLPLTPLHHLQGYVVGHSVGFSQRPGARFWLAGTGRNS